MDRCLAPCPYPHDSPCQNPRAGLRPAIPDLCLVRTQCLLPGAVSVSSQAA